MKANAPPLPLKVFAAILRAVHAAAHDEDVVGVLRIHHHADVVAGAADQRAIPADDLPRRAGVVGPPDRSLIGGLDQRVHPLACSTARSATSILPNGDFGMPVVTFVHLAPPSVRQVDAAAGTAAALHPGVLLDLPGAGEQRVRILASIDRPEQPVLRSTKSTRCQLAPPSVVLKTPRSSCGPVSRPWRADVDDVGVGRMDEDARDAAGLDEAHVLPGLAGVVRDVDAVAHDVAVADDPGFAGPDPDDVGIAVGDGNRRQSRDTGWSSKIGTNVCPASVDFHTPPDAEPR